MKKRLTQSEEFEIMKLVCDKFLWLGIIGMAMGFYNLINDKTNAGIYFLIGGIVVLIVFVMILMKEYELTK